MINGITLVPGNDLDKFHSIKDWRLLFHEWLEKIEKNFDTYPEVFKEAIVRLQDLVKRITDVPVNEIRVGATSCEKEIPSISDLKKAYELSCQTDVGLSIEIPVIPQSEWNYFSKILDFLVSTNTKVALVLNDIGALMEAVSRNLTCISAGRFLCKQKKLARFNKSEFELLGQNIIQEYQIFESSKWEKIYPVKSFELDLLPQGTLLDPCNSSISWHVPWCIVSFGRICYIGSINSSQHNKFKLSTNCDYECKDIIEFYDNSSWPNQLIRRGKSIYCLSEMSDFSWLEYSSSSRIVIDMNMLNYVTLQ